MRFAIATTIALGLGLAGMGCNHERIRQGEGSYCSTDEDEDPHFECSPAYDYVCIATYTQDVFDRNGNMRGVEDRYLCRETCTPEKGCRNADDVCCPGKTYKSRFASNYACVPSQYCNVPVGDGGAPADAGNAKGDAARDGGTPAEAGIPRTDAGGAADGGGDAAAGADDGGAPVDAPADAPTTTGATG
jgi:hypothetical protein